MQERAAHELADKVRRHLTGVQSVMAVDAVHYRPHLGPDDGWAVQVVRPPRNGGPVQIVGSDRTGYSTTADVNAHHSLVTLVREVFLTPPEDEHVWPDDAELGAGIRAACVAIGHGRERLQALALDVETRRQVGAWLVLVEDNVPIDCGPGMEPVVYGPYLHELAATEACERILTRLRPLPRYEGVHLVASTYQAQPEPKEA